MSIYSVLSNVTYTKRFVLVYHHRALLPILITFMLILSSLLSGVQPKTIKIGVYENDPKIFTSESGKPEGIFIDIIESIAKDEGWKLQYVIGTWEEGLERLTKGEIDLMPDVAYNSERDKLYSFHKVPVLSSWSQVFASKDSGINSILDMNGKRIAVLQGSVQQRAFEGLAIGFGQRISLLAYPTFDAAFEAVVQNKADAVVTNNFYGLIHARKLGLEDTAVVFNPSTLFFAARINANQDVLDALDKHLIALKQDSHSTYYKSLNRWTSEKIKYIIPLWIRILAGFLVAILFLSIIIVFIFKRQVNLKTKELRQANREMGDRIVERTWELEEAMEKAKDADRLKSAFLAIMSHELRTPLNSIIGFTGILLQELAGPMNEEQKKQLKMVQNSSRHLLSLINDVLDISKIEAGQLDMCYDYFDAKVLILKVMKLIQPLADKKGLEIRFEACSITETIYSDQRRVEQMLLNLLSNAVKFTETGSVTITGCIEDNMCRMEVIDTGIGMKEEELKKLFIPFSQIDSGLTRKYEGTGLGLSICKKLIELLHGSISVESEIGKGSIFKLSFPAKSEGNI